MNSSTVEDSIPIAVRGYVAPPPLATDRYRPKVIPDAGPSDWALTFDCETTVDPSQRLRFGVYQVRKSGVLQEAGLFHDPKALKLSEQRLLAGYAQRANLTLRTVAEFVEEVFFGIGYDLRATIIGFNLPFDLSRLAIGHGNARGKAYRGGFSFKLSPDDRLPRVQIKHLSRRASLIRFAAPAKQRQSRGQRRRKVRIDIRRGYFVDTKALGSALTGQSHSLTSLSALLGTAHRKQASSEHGTHLTTRYLDYALNDVRATWECYEKLVARYQRFGLTGTGVHQIYSEASIGKACLRHMGIRPWREMQPEFPPELIGLIASSYYGGRSDVHLRRVVKQVLYYDFLSMYPTVCTLMELWQFVIARGMAYEDATTDVQQLLATVTPEALLTPTFWKQLPVIVQVRPEHDLLPVRARYSPASGAYTIAQNYLTSEQPLCYTLSDCITAALLTGKPPQVLRAWRFTPLKPQAELRPVSVAGTEERIINPVTDDFYQYLIDQRTEVKAQRDDAVADSNAALAAQLDAEQQALKIIANATSYGIFFEMNVTDFHRPRNVTVYGTEGKGFQAWVKSIEEPGRYFHPLVASLITGAARLMLALCERRVHDAGLEWAFCDTDSMAIARPEHMDELEFKKRATTVREGFDSLNPYRHKGPILKIEEVNQPLAGRSGIDVADALYCFAISPKRYALFNIDRDGRPLLRKAMAHGLGHLLAPYEDGADCAEIPAPLVPLAEIGVARWQHDLWYLIVQSALAGRPDIVGVGEMAGFDAYAVSQYAATTPNLLRWFDAYNTDKLYAEHVKPFNFLLMYQADQHAWQANRDQIDGMTDLPSAVAPYAKDTTPAARTCFDRRTGQPVPVVLLKSIAKTLARYHLHPESKYRRADYTDRGRVEPRHILATHVEHIGKEANRWEEQYYLGEASEAQIEYRNATPALDALRREARAFSQRALAQASGVSLRQVSAILCSKAVPTSRTLRALERGVRLLTESLVHKPV